DRRPDEPVAGLERGSLVVARRHLLQPAADPEPRAAFVPQGVVWRVVALLDLRRPQCRREADPADADVRDLDVRLFEPARVLPLVDVVEVGPDLRRPGLVDRAGRRIHAELVALAEVAALGDPVDLHV